MFLIKWASGATLSNCSCGITRAHAHVCSTPALGSVVAGSYTQVPHKFKNHSNACLGEAWSNSTGCTYGRHGDTLDRNIQPGASHDIFGDILDVSLPLNALRQNGNGISEGRSNYCVVEWSLGWLKLVTMKMNNAHRYYCCCGCSCSRSRCFRCYYCRHHTTL